MCRTDPRHQVATDLAERAQGAGWPLLTALLLVAEPGGGAGDISVWSVLVSSNVQNELLFACLKPELPTTWADLARGENIPWTLAFETEVDIWTGQGCIKWADDVSLFSGMSGGW